MNTGTHPIEHEEVMAYLDGELQEDRSAVVAAHLGSCDECQRLAAELGNVSDRLRSWQVESPEPGLFLPGVAEARRKSQPARKPWFESSLVSWAVTAAVCLVVVVGTLRLIGTNANTMSSQVAFREDARSPGPRASPQDKFVEQSANLSPALATPRALERIPSALPASKAPSAAMIERTAALSLTVQDFGKARTHLDEILAQHRGYLGDLQVSTPSDQGRVLKGTLRVPTGQLDSTLTELKTLGRVESESQSGQEVTAQYVDLQARLANSRNTEQRLTQVLQQRTGKLSDVLEVETEIARVRGEIESMEAERKNMASQVAFATLNVTLAEEYKPQLQTVPPSTLRQFRNSAVEGYQTMVGGVIALVNLLLSYGPSVLLWGLFALLPVRFLLRRLATKTP